MEKTYRIPKDNLLTLNSKMEKLNRRIATMCMRAKIDFKDIIYTVSDLQQEKRGDGKLFLYYDVTVVGEPVRIEGWELIAVIDYGSNGNTLRAIPGFDLGDRDLEKYRNSEDYCEHCNTNRHRKSMYIVRNVETHETKQVGRNCCKEFLGFDPHYVAEYSSWEKILEECEEGEYEEGCGGFSPTAYNLVDFLAFTIQCIRIDGWKPRSGGFRSATADCVDFLFGVKPYVPPCDKDLESAQEMIDWAIAHIQEKQYISDYEHNLSIVLTQGYVRFKQIGIAASIVPYVTREKGKQVELRKQQESSYIGTVGVRETFMLTYVTNYGFETDWGYTYIHKFVDDDGNIVVWKTSKDLDEIEQGSKYKVTGKVIRHDTYRNIKQTNINRCNIKVCDE